MPTGPSSGCAGIAPRQDGIYRLWITLPLVIVAGLLGLDRTGIDLAIAAWIYDPAVHAFPLRTTFLFETVLHHWTKYVVISIACLAWAGYLLTYAVPGLCALRRELLFLGLGLALAPTAVSALKLASDRHCPWDVAEFGGFAPYLALLDAAPASLAPGHCFPAGHATTGFCLMAFYFVGRSARKPTLAWSGFVVGFAAGLGLGFGRMMQGAHFLSHVLWAGIVCWAVLVVLYALILQPTAIRLKSAT